MSISSGRYRVKNTWFRNFAILASDNVPENVNYFLSLEWQHNCELYYVWYIPHRNWLACPHSGVLLSRKTRCTPSRIMGPTPMPMQGGVPMLAPQSRDESSRKSGEFSIEKRIDIRELSTFVQADDIMTPMKQYWNYWHWNSMGLCHYWERNIGGNMSSSLLCSRVLMVSVQVHLVEPDYATDIQNQWIFVKAWVQGRLVASLLWGTVCNV